MPEPSASILYIVETVRSSDGSQSTPYLGRVETNAMPPSGSQQGSMSSVPLWYPPRLNFFAASVSSGSGKVSCLSSEPSISAE